MSAALPWLVMAMLLATAPQMRVTQPAPAGTAALRGQITDKDTGAPIPRAIVTARFIGQGNGVMQALADHDGRFELSGLAGGRYELSAIAGENRAGYLRGTYQDRATASGGGSLLLLKDGEIRTDVNIALPRTAAVSGRVVDEFGDPLAGVNLRLVPVGVTSMPSFPRGGATDDRGVFRFYGVAPGRYLVCTELTNMGLRSAGGGSAERFVSTCHPSALQESDAQPVLVTSAEVDGIEIRMRKSRTFSISGIIVDSTGAPFPSPSISLSQFRANGSGGTGTTLRDARFVFNGLLPGEYAVEAANRPDPSPERETGHMLVQLGHENIDDLVITLKPAATVRGVVTYEDAPPAEARVTLIAIGVKQSLFRGFAAPLQVQSDNSFTLTGLSGAVRVNVQGLPPGWALKTMRYRGQDITDVPTEFVNDPKSQLEVVLTSRLAVVSGTVMNDMASAAEGATVVMLSADPRRWDEGVANRFRRAGVTKAGAFKLPGVPSGDYLILAVPGEQARGLDMRQIDAALLAKYAERVSLVENDRLTMNLRVVTLPDTR